MALDVNLSSIGLELGTGAVIGFIIGYAFKMVAKIVAVIVGLELALFSFLESRGILVVKWDRLSGGLIEATDVATASQPPSWMTSIISTLSVGAGFTGGFLVGFKKG
ncbi:putative membrane protein, Fun14 family [Halanaeroarchaeum sp. HSR-CO]|uniref:FUN14 domain-containing protein n=1 Tax=Halanaeroarchaeum sp. HSR-CO TaxID=2866382 RepID=UPI00217E8A5D|nr:FUN14 domain-containing protein [Halanaeroarchaeum sp. HSR-CO]UWG48364.1 putative membrane protein, Fun14 family [Halanaeroarchaeum sp. HSR-CO]